MPIHPLNPDAGHVPCPEDPQELAAALAASRVRWRLFPYLALRFGERGWRFNQSDTAWLVTLCHLELRLVREQVLWLGGLLSNRGMPRWLLEVQLEALGRELSRRVPWHRKRWDKLRTVAGELRGARLVVMPPARAEELAARFAAELELSRAPLVRGTGLLICAALADEKLGVPNAVSSLETWLCDRELFSRRWVSGVRSLVRAGRAL